MLGHSLSLRTSSTAGPGWMMRVLGLGKPRGAGAGGLLPNLGPNDPSPPRQGQSYPLTCSALGRAMGFHPGCSFPLGHCHHHHNHCHLLST